MKTTAFILLFCFSFLAAEPLTPLLQKAFAKEEACTMSCCHHKAVPKQHKIPLGSCCGGMMCNPFGQYACCTGFVVERESLPITVSQIKKEILSVYKTTVITGFNTDCWRPPENAVS